LCDFDECVTITFTCCYVSILYDGMLIMLCLFR
jgi:hypothetical protein